MALERSTLLFTGRPLCLPLLKHGCYLEREELDSKYVVGIASLVLLICQ